MEARRHGGQQARSAPRHHDFRQASALANGGRKVFMCSSIPDCLAKHKLAAGFTAQLLSQHQMTKKTEGK